MRRWLSCLTVAAGFGIAAWTIQKSRREEDEFRDLLRDLTFGSSPDEVLRRIAERATRLVGGAAAYIERLDAERDEIVVSAVHRGERLPAMGTRGPYKGSLAQQAIQTKTQILVADVGQESRSMLGTIEHRVPAVILPLITDSTAIGALIVLEGKKRISARSIDRLRTMADMSAISIRRAMMVENLERSLHVREELQRVLAHDLRNAINTIAVAASALNRFSGPGTTEERLVEMIRRSSGRINRLIQDLIDTAVIERRGELPLTTEEHPSQNLAEEICELTRIQAKAKTVRVQCDIHGSVTVCVDRDRVLQVLGNLVDNAVKFTPEGGTITVTSEAERDEVRFSIADTGPGVPAADRDRVFQAYWQAPATAHLGAGLGLSIAKQIVEQHGGRIWVENAAGPGAKFVFTIPAATKEPRGE